MENEQEKREFAARLNEALDDRGIPLKDQGRQVAVGKMFGVSQKGARKWLEGEGFPNLAKCIEIAMRLSVSFEWLMTGRGEKLLGIPRAERQALPAISDDTFVQIAVYDAAASMGLGRPAPDFDLIVDHISVGRDWLKRKVSFSSVKNLALIPAFGDSMVPTFDDGDILLVDRGIFDVRFEAVYVLSLEGELYIKRLQRGPEKSILMLSDNKKYDTRVIPAPERQQFQVLGRVLLAWNAQRM